MSAKAQVSFATVVHGGPPPAAKALVSFGTLVHGGPPPAAKAQVSFATLVHGGPPPAARVQVSFATLVHEGVDAPVGGGIAFPFTSRSWGQGDSIDGQDTLTLWGME